MARDGDGDGSVCGYEGGEEAGGLFSFLFRSTELSSRLENDSNCFAKHEIDFAGLIRSCERRSRRISNRARLNKIV
jgi:hypothetical protein